MVRAKFVAVLANNAHKPAVPAILASFCLSNRITKRWWWESLYLYSSPISRICPRVTVSVYGYICFWNRMVTLKWLGIIYEMISDVIRMEVSIYSEVFLFVITDLRKCVWLRPGCPYSIMSQTLAVWHCTTVKVVYSTMALSSKMKIVKRITT